MRRNTRIVIGLAAVAGLSLTGCQKPPPSITVWTGAESLNQPALCWAFESDILQPGECAEEILQGQNAEALTIIKPVAGNTVGISVDPEVAESGWTPVLGGQRVTQTPLTSTYFRFTFPLGVPQTGVPLQVVAGKDAKTKGIWSVRLIPGDS